MKTEYEKQRQEQQRLLEERDLRYVRRLAALAYPVNKNTEYVNVENKHSSYNVGTGRRLVYHETSPSTGVFAPQKTYLFKLQKWGGIARRTRVLVTVWMDYSEELNVVAWSRLGRCLHKRKEIKQ